MKRQQPKRNHRHPERPGGHGGAMGIPEVALLAVGSQGDLVPRALAGLKGWLEDSGHSQALKSSHRM